MLTDPDKTLSPLSIDEIALGMLKRYSTPEKALAMAWEHACSYDIRGAGFEHWKTVYDRIKQYINEGWKK